MILCLHVLTQCRSVTNGQTNRQRHLQLLRATILLLSREISLTGQREKA